MPLFYKIAGLEMSPVADRPTYLSTILFYLVLFSLLVGTLLGFPGNAALMAFVVILLQLKWANWSTALVKLVAMAFVLGGAMESISVHQGLVIYQGAHGYHALPWWMLMFWMLMALHVFGRTGCLRGKPIQALLLGAAIGPAFLLAGDQMRILSLPDLSTGLIWAAFEWASLFGVLSVLAKRYKPH